MAELRERNAEWAESAVRTAASLQASAALEQKVIDVIASDLPDLLRKIDGCSVKVSTGEVTGHSPSAMRSGFASAEFDAAPSNTRSIASPATRDHADAPGARSESMPKPLAISRAPSMRMITG